MAEDINKIMENKDVRLGFHLGTVDCLKKERMELLKIVKMTEELMVLHAKELKKLGIDITKKPEDNTKLEEQL